MISVKGKIQNGKVLALEPVNAFEGREVTISLDEISNGKPWEDANGNKYGHWQQMMDAIRDSMDDEEITDLAHQHDYYLYGTPKRED